MRLFLKLFIAYYFGYTYPGSSLYMPLKLLWLEIEWPGMLWSLWQETGVRDWTCEQIAIAIDFALLYGVVRLLCALFLAARKRLSGLFVRKPRVLVVNPL